LRDVVGRTKLEGVWEKPVELCMDRCPIAQAELEDEKRVGICWLARRTSIQRGVMRDLMERLEVDLRDGAEDDRPREVEARRELAGPGPLARLASSVPKDASAAASWPGEAEG
jgi:hypothetical protein